MGGEPRKVQSLMYLSIVLEHHKGIMSATLGRESDLCTAGLGQVI